MVRMIFSLILLACLLAPGVRAQATADQLNKLSLEALTAPGPRGSAGGRGYSPSARHRPAWLPHRSSGHVAWRSARAPRYYQPPRYRAPRYQAHRYQAHRYQAHRYQAPRAHYAAPYRAPRPAYRANRYTPRYYRR